MSTIKKIALTLLSVVTFALAIAGLATLKTEKAYADGVLYTNINVGKDISLKVSAVIDGATSASATFTWKGNDETGAEKEESYVDVVTGEKTEEGKYLFTYKGIGAQYLGKTVMVVVKYDTENSTDNVYTEKTISVKDVLNAYRSSSAAELGISPAAFQKIKTLSADILNYGAAAQKYTKVDVSALVNDGLTNSDYTAVDFSALSGEISKKGNLGWVMGVRFDCNIQPMARFTTTAQNLTAKINGKAVGLKTVSENVYQIVYNDFNILSVNDEYTFEVFSDEQSIGSVKCSLAALAKTYDIEILRAAYVYGVSVSSYLEAKKELVVEAESDYVIREKADGTALNIETRDGVTFVKDLDGNANASITFVLNAEEPCEATLKATLRMMPWAFPLQQYVGIEVNGVAFDYNKMLPKDENAAHDTPAKCDFASVEFGKITLKKGANTIKFIVKEAGYPQCPDFDKIEIFGEASISENTHKCESVCPVCRKCTNENCNEYVCEDKCECKYSVIEAESDCVTITQAQTPAAWGGVVKGSNEYGGYVKAENGNAGSKITFNFTCETAGKALLRVYIAPKCDDYYFHNEYTVTINGVAYAFESKKVNEDTELADNQWLARNYVCVVIGEIDLISGENTVEFTQKGYAGTIMDKIDFISTTASITETNMQK